MRVDPRDGRCRDCGGQLEIVETDDATMTVECQNEECYACYAVEPDAFGDGCMIYFFGILAEKLAGGDD